MKNMGLDKKILALTSVVFVLWGCTKARSISGRVVDQEEKPIPGVRVSITNSTLVTTTDSNGNYVLPWVEGDVAIIAEPPDEKRFGTQDFYSDLKKKVEDGYVIDFSGPKWINFSKPGGLSGSCGCGPAGKNIHLTADRYPKGYQAPDFVFVNLEVALEKVRVEKELKETKEKEKEQQRNLLIAKATAELSAELFEVQDDVFIQKSTGLMWQRGDNNENVSFTLAMFSCYFLRLNGKEDWRLPTLQELLKLISDLVLLKKKINSLRPGIDVPSNVFHGSRLDTNWSNRRKDIFDLNVLRGHLEGGYWSSTMKFDEPHIAAAYVVSPIPDEGNDFSYRPSNEQPKVTFLSGILDPGKRIALVRAVRSDQKRQEVIHVTEQALRGVWLWIDGSRSYYDEGGKLLAEYIDNHAEKGTWIVEGKRLRLLFNEKRKQNYSGFEAMEKPISFVADVIKLTRESVVLKPDEDATGRQILGMRIR